VSSKKVSGGPVVFFSEAFWNHYSLSEVVRGGVFFSVVVAYIFFKTWDIVWPLGKWVLFQYKRVESKRDRPILVGTVCLSSQNLIEFSSSVFFRLCVCVCMFVFVSVKGEKKVAEIIQYVHDLSLICLVSSRLSRICCQAVFVMSVLLSSLHALKLIHTLFRIATTNLLKCLVFVTTVLYIVGMDHIESGRFVCILEINQLILQFLQLIL